jgi:thymidine kinase
MSMLIVVGGPMFAGKTTWLLNYASGQPPQSYRMFKPSMDTRFDVNAAVTHDGARLPALNISIDAPRFPKMPEGVRTILIDELNFFHPETLLPELVTQLELGRTIVAGGLVYDFLKRPFGATLPLSIVADRFVRVYARCDSCGKKAWQSYRKVHTAAQVMLGAEEAYGACCERCWKKFNSATATASAATTNKRKRRSARA